jgi:hypothetical protein
MKSIDMEFEYKNNFVTFKDDMGKYYEWTITDKKSVSSSVSISYNIKDKFITFLKIAQKKTCMFDSMSSSATETDHTWTISIIHDSEKIMIVNSVRFQNEENNELDQGSYIKISKKKFIFFLNQVIDKMTLIEELDADIAFAKEAYQKYANKQITFSQSKLEKIAGLADNDITKQFKKSFSNLGKNR